MDTAKWQLTQQEEEELNELMDKALAIDPEGKTLPRDFMRTGDPSLGMACLATLYRRRGPDAVAKSGVLDFVNGHINQFVSSELPRLTELLLKRGVDHGGQALRGVLQDGRLLRARHAPLGAGHEHRVRALVAQL